MHLLNINITLLLLLFILVIIIQRISSYPIHSNKLQFKSSSPTLSLPKLSQQSSASCGSKRRATQLINYISMLDEFAIDIQVPRSLYETLINGFNFLKFKSNISSALFQLGLITSARTFIPITSMFGFTSFLIILFFLIKDNKKSPYDDNNIAIYDIQKAEKFYRHKPQLVIARLLKITSLVLNFNLKILKDWRFDELIVNESIRAEECVAVISQLGPTFIKLGQALSIRTDLIPPTYAKALKKLQDAVPCFSSAIAKKIICKELGITHLSDRFRTFSNEPIAAASIGQVYKATLLNGREVAVKVQRPNILPSIALDLYILRLLTPIQVKISNRINGSKTVPADFDLAYSLVDEWGKGLVAEVDYQLEAKNTKQFSEAMCKRGLNAVISPEVIENSCTSKVMVTEWIDGTRLDRDDSADVPRLCGLAVNAYLTMLLDTGVLHCDPHPGNLLRTKDGRLCILDWGMTLTLPSDLQYGLLEFIAHCNSENFSELAEDFVKLGATPPEKIEEVRNSGIPEGFAFIMKQLSAGGGPSQLTSRLRNEFKAKYGDSLSDVELGLKIREEMLSPTTSSTSSSSSSSTTLTKSEIEVAEAAANLENADVSGVAGILEMMSKKNREIFKLPAYMLYVTRAFSTLEGIGLSIDPSYSILQECYPYLAKRLMTDNSPRSRQALRNMLYHDGKLSTNKLKEFSDGFTSYTASTTAIDTNGEGQRKAQEAFTDLLLSKDSNIMQEVLIDGAAQLTDSLLRVGVHKMKDSRGGQIIKIALKTPKSIVDTIVPSELRIFAFPLTLPYDVAKAVSNIAEQNDNDKENVESISLIWNNMRPRIRNRLRKMISDTTKPRIPFFKAILNRRKSREDNGDDGSITISNDYDDDNTNERLPITVRTSNRLKKSLGNAKKINKRLPVVMRLSAQLGANVFSQAADRIDDTKKHYANENEINLNRSGMRINREYEIQSLMTETISFITSNTAKIMARLLGKRSTSSSPSASP